MRDSYCIILCTTGSKEEAEGLAKMLVSRKLAACVQITPITSYYMWNGELHDDAEHLLLIKTVAARYEDIQSAILAKHTYDVPEIVRLPVEQGLDRYLAWVSENTSET